MEQARESIWTSAARGVLQAQRAMVQTCLALGEQGITNRRDAVEHSLNWARIAAANSCGIEDKRAMVEALHRCLEDAVARADGETVIRYTVEAAALVDLMADEGDEAAAEQAATTLGNLPPDVLRLVPSFRALWEGRAS